MFCTTCGAQARDSSGFCNNCGRPMTAAAAPTRAHPGAGPTQAQAPSGAQNDGGAIASLVLGIMSMTLFSIFAGIPAIILGHISRSRIARSMGRLKGEGMALAGLIMGYISLVAIPFILIIAAIAIPNLLRSRIAANESSAVGSIRTIVTVADTYQAMYPQAGYPARLGDLGGSGTNPSETEAGLVDDALASGTKAGYVFYYEPTDSDGDGVRDNYFVRADPLQPNTTGQRSFCADSSGVIRFEHDGQCTLESAPIQ
jgi:type IV pilus assembly protein PilA